jgi:uncharacterized membrane protein YccC
MGRAIGWFASQLNRARVVHSLRTSVAALASLVGAGLLRLPEAYWAVVTAMIVMQSTLGAALGAAAGALLIITTYFGSKALVFTAGVFALGLICAVLHLDRSGYRFASISLAIVMLVPRTNAASVVATDRFVET